MFQTLAILFWALQPKAFLTLMSCSVDLTHAPWCLKSLTSLFFLNLNLFLFFSAYRLDDKLHKNTCAAILSLGMCQLVCHLSEKPESEIRQALTSKRTEFKTNFSLCTHFLFCSALWIYICLWSWRGHVSRQQHLNVL